MTNTAPNLLRAVFWLSLTLTVYTYFLYPLLLMLLSSFIKRLGKNRPLPPLLSDDALPALTMVISAYNERASLPQKIANCKNLDYPPDKISFLIGSDGSTDGTARVLRRIDDPRFAAVISRIRRGKVRMLNHLMNKVASEIVVFSDANTLYAPEALRRLVRCFQDPRVGAVIGKLDLFTPNRSPRACSTENLYWRYENRIKQMENTFGSVPAVNGGIFAIRRHLFGPLPENAVTEDQVLGMKIMAAGYRCVFAPDAHARESVSDWTGELRRRIRISAGNFQSLFLVPSILNPRLGWVCFAFISHKLLRWLVPFFLLAMLSSNLLLARQLFYGSTLLLQGLFYTLALLAALLPQLSAAVKIFALPKYFLTMNFAILVGLARALSRRQRVTWSRSHR